MKTFFYIVLFNVIISTCVFPQVNFTSSNLPIVIINTGGKEIPGEPKIDASMSIINNGKGKLNYVTDTVYDYSGKIGIEIRGQSSQQFPKKQFGFETRDSAGNNLDVSLLGMPADNDWILYAPYSDKTMMRNVLAYKFANDLGRYATRTKFCEVMLNGQYWGVYIMMEKIKRNKGRVNIKKLEAKDTTGDALTGGYIYKIDKLDSGQDEGWSSKYKGYNTDPSSVMYLYSYPDQDKIVNKQKAYIKSLVDNFEYVMNKATYNHPITGYYDLIDISSFVDTYLINEFCKNVDGYRLSTYFYKDRDSQDGRIKYGPVWDFDISLGNVNYDDANLTSGWEVNNINASSNAHAPAWMRRLMTDPVFANSFAKRWSEVKNTVFNLDSISAYIDTTTAGITDARVRNFIKWNNVIGTYIWPNNYIGKTYEDEVKYLKSWMADRVNWINNNIPSTYTDLTWLSPDLSSISFDANNKAVISSKIFYKDASNVDSVTFFSGSDTLKVLNGKDSAVFTATGPGKFKIKAAAWHNNKIVAASSAYFITSNVTGIADKNAKPADYKLSQNYPNPFNPSTIIEYSIPKSGHVTIKIYDVLGNEIATLVNEYKNAGIYNMEFNTNYLKNTSASRSMLSSGIYLYRMTAGEFMQAKKFVLMK